ncbi:MAG TPA: hypothetical protein VII38_17420 [Polyangia bacterium]|jgi:Spy/CpxP family protein refolding chaperone
MNRILKLAAVVTALAALLAGVALGQHHRFAKRAGLMMPRAIDGALDAAHATPPERQAIYAARDRVLTALAKAGGDSSQDLDRVLALFSADPLDARALAAERARRLAAFDRVGDAIVQAFSDAHHALSAPERQAAADYLRAREKERAEKGSGWRERIFHAIVEERTQAALDAIDATADQRAALIASRDRVLAALKEARLEGAARPLLDLFVADPLDGHALQALRAERLGRLNQVGDAIVEGLSEIHQQLTPPQRQKLVAWVRSHTRHRG